MTAFFCLIEGQQQKLHLTKTCPADFCPVVTAYKLTGLGRQHFVSALASSKTELLAFSSPLAYVSRKFCSNSVGICHHWLQRVSDRKVFCGQFQCSLAVFLILCPSDKRGVHGLFRDPSPAVHPQHSFLDLSRAQKPKSNERHHHRVLWRTSGSWSPNCPVSKSFCCSSFVSSRVAFGLLPNHSKQGSFFLWHGPEGNRKLFIFKYVER